MRTDTRAPALVIELSDKPGDVRTLLDFLLAIAEAELHTEAVKVFYAPRTTKAGSAN